MTVRHDSSEVFRIGFTVLDRQIADRDGRLTGKADDIELSWEEGGRPVMSALLTDSAALGPRLSGRLGRAWQTLLRRLRPGEPEPVRIPVADVTEFAPTTRLSTAAPEEVWALEDWLRRRFIGHFPGADDADDTRQ
ncbi:hypothetical protein HDA32_002851 [Spinactinospora alkalitolerans]|uniref:Uncharacterized protein n=1 Tax=Spinactinospora alkalitolerans TaxID=687207 RepID=A0A852TVK5_9ACTN|nr:hypothetical protein [Spinactinospora alkalitolerans]NYE47731.1 hypothetical protein [Spinactinospora alkalitolerans]